MINDNSNLFTVCNIEKHPTNCFRLFVINSLEENYRLSEIILDPINTNIETNPAHNNVGKDISWEYNNYKYTRPKFRFETIFDSRNLFAEALMSGKNEFNMQQCTDMVIVKIEDKGKILVTMKIITRLR